MDGTTVALVSVVVTGLITPIITSIAARFQVRLANQALVEKEYRDVVDDATDKLAKVARASGHLVALWSRGVPSDSDEALRELALRNTCGELMLAAHGRLAIRFGPSSGTAERYRQAIVEIDRYLKPIGDYRSAGDYDRWRDELVRVGLAVGQALSSFTEAASLEIRASR